MFPIRFILKHMVIFNRYIMTDILFQILIPSRKSNIVRMSFLLNVLQRE